MLTHSREVLVRKNETLAFMPLFENIARLEHLDTYDAGLGGLIESPQVNRTDTMRHYLSELTVLKIAAPVWQALSRCASRGAPGIRLGLSLTVTCSMWTCMIK